MFNLLSLSTNTFVLGFIFTMFFFWGTIIFSPWIRHDFLWVWYASSWENVLEGGPWDFASIWFSQPQSCRTRNCSARVLRNCDNSIRTFLSRCSMVLEYLPTFARTKSPSYVVEYAIHGACGSWFHDVSWVVSCRGGDVRCHPGRAWPQNRILDPPNLGVDRMGIPKAPSERCCLEQLSCAENSQWQYMMVRKCSSNQILHGSFVGIHGTNGHLLECRSWIIHWLVVWNMKFMFPFSWEFHHPNWQTHIFRRGRFTTNQYIWQCEIPNCSCLIFDFLFLFCCDLLVFFA